ncbi:FAD-binding oxidoreductase [Leeia sp. TBRC 13508]|uniref:FAD-binding oxidoreductase n=1 Tax=Leeia speluncae TaxID=2884804 RepID=A0ABS8DA12_9NEIS|nr:FAD-binding oxidoreductase [Leeia speluncae]MCB6185014.1 FAD-binding oxidoreductase [Leeia speluncae]
MNTTSNQGKQVTVIGGGIIGLCCGLFLQKKGFSVTIVDPVAPADSTAKWSCGQMAVSEVIPLSKPGILKKVPGWLLDSKGPLALRPSAIPRILPWLLRFVGSARHSKILEISEAIGTLTSDVYSDYDLILNDCKEKDLLGSTPVLEVFDAYSSIEKDKAHFDIRTSLGFKSRIVNGKEIGDLEPDFAGKFSHGVVFEDWRTVKDTAGFLQALADSFTEQGGILIQDKVVSLDYRADVATGVKLMSGKHIAADQIVVAAGVGSNDFFKSLGLCIPLAGIAGYQVLLPNSGKQLSHSVIYADGGFSFSPFSRGLQIGGTIEFAGKDAAPNFARADIILEKAKKIFPDMNVIGAETAVGYRPFLPDTKPIIDRSNKYKNVLLAFGHGQLGLTLGATTGKIIAEMACGNPSPVNLAPFSATRFM